jgi:L-lysine 2,3-aminomutase
VYQPRNRRIFFILQWLNREAQRLNLRFNHPKINEVILSGGDPLSLSDEKLAQLIKGIENI